MNLKEERMQILRMIQSGQISAEEGAKLLSALEGSQKSEMAANVAATQGKFLRVRVTDMSTGKTKVNVNVPLALVNVGLKMGARFMPDLGGLDINDMAGDLTLEDGLGDVVIAGATGAVRLDNVKGDLRASDLGSLVVEGSLDGDAVISSVAGGVQLDGVAGDLQVSETGSFTLTGDLAGSARISHLRGACMLGDV